MNEVIRNLKRRLMKVYDNLYTTEDLDELSQVMKDIFNTCVANHDKFSFNYKMKYFTEFNDIHEANKEKLFKALEKGSKIYLLESDDIYLHRTYEIPKEGHKFVDEILNRYTLTSGLEKMPVIYSLKFDEGLTIGANEVIYRLKEV